MNKLVVSALLALVTSAVAVGAPAVDQKYIMSPEQIVEHRHKMDMKRFGGIVRKANSAAGKVVFLNAQKAVKAAELKAALDEIDAAIHPLWELKDVDSVKLANPSADIAKTGAKVGVVLAESADLPVLLVAPEEGWAIVNVTPLKDGAKDDVLANRVRVELLRAFALAGGSAFGARDPVVLRADIRKPTDLDMIKYASYGVDAKGTLARNLPGLGVTPWKVASYRQACKEGWAPSPTNDVQKKIWDKAHQLPTNPLPLVKPTK